MIKQETKPAVRTETRQDWPLTPWEPFTTMSRMRESVEQMFNDLFRTLPIAEPTAVSTFLPAVDLYRTGDALVAELAVPGFKGNEIDIEASRDHLTIKGEYKHADERKAVDTYRKEIACGHFHRSLSLPCSIVAEHVCAKLDNGVLRVSMPLSQPEVHKTTRVKID